MLAHGVLAQDFTDLNQQYGKLVEALLDAVAMPGTPVHVGQTLEGNFPGFEDDRLYVVRSGALVARYRDKAIHILEEGDILLPDFATDLHGAGSVCYGSDTGAELTSYPAKEFMERVHGSPAATRLWTRLLATYAALMLRVAAAEAVESPGLVPTFEIYDQGEVIIQQGEQAEDVFHMMSGSAEVVVDGIVVGNIGEGEIFGAMATLTHADRSATVRTKTECSVVKVPKDQFTELIQSSPAAIHSLLIDMAHSIAKLNEQLVGLRGSQSMD